MFYYFSIKSELNYVATYLVYRIKTEFKVNYKASIP